MRQGHVIRCASERAFPRGASSFQCQQAARALDCTTMDITPVFNQVLAKHDAKPVEPYIFRVEDLDEFLKEAYRIVGHVAR
jgi:hypothetical protein